MKALNPNLDLVNISAQTKFGKIVPINSQDIERKHKSDINQGPYLCKNLQKMTGNNPYLDIVNINAHTKFGRILSISSQDKNDV